MRSYLPNLSRCPDLNWNKKIWIQFLQVYFKTYIFNTLNWNESWSLHLKKFDFSDSLLLKCVFIEQYQFDTVRNSVGKQLTCFSYLLAWSRNCRYSEEPFTPAGDNLRANLMVFPAGRGFPTSQVTSLRFVSDRRHRMSTFSWNVNLNI